MTLKNYENPEEELTCLFKIESNLTNFDLSTGKYQKFTI